jgi:hypothetical protein
VVLSNAIVDVMVVAAVVVAAVVVAALVMAVVVAGELEVLIESVDAGSGGQRSIYQAWIDLASSSPHSGRQSKSLT